MILSLFERLETTQQAICKELDNWSVPIPFKLPAGFQLILSCTDVSGSNTRILVKQVVAWLEGGDNFELFDQIQEIIEEFIAAIATSEVMKLREISRRLKQVLWRLSEESGVEVLPLQIKEILEDVEEALEDVAFCSVPGAGGYDAFYFIVNKNSWEEAKNYILSRRPELIILNVYQASD